MVNEHIGNSEPKEIASLKEDITKLSEAVGVLTAKVDAKTPASSNRNKSTAWINAKRSITEPNIPKRRRGDTGSPIFSPTMASRIYGTKPMNDKLKIVQLKNDTLWIYLSAFDPQTTEREIASLVRECLNLSSDTEPEVVKLVPRGKELSAMSFVSFKVGISPQLKCIALARDSWPENVFFREFEDRSKNQPEVTRITRIVQTELQPLDGDPIPRTEA